MLEPEDAEEELFALRGTLAGTRMPIGCIGMLGLAFSLLICIGAGMMSFGRSPVGGVVNIVFAVLYAIGPGLLVAAAMQRPRDIDDSRAAIRQARLLTGFWWLTAVVTLISVVLNVIGFALMGLSLLG